jgi:hypothetical protein
MELSPSIWYRRKLPDADFSLEANTGDVPRKGRFYVLRHEEVVFSSDTFSEALTTYHDMCRLHWQQHLHDEARSDRMTAAWGLLGLDPTDKDAAEVIRTEGIPEEQRRLNSVRQRHFARSRALMRKGRAG